MWIALALLVAAAGAGAIAADGVLLSIALPFAAVLFGIAYTGYRLRRPGRARIARDEPRGPDDAPVMMTRDGPTNRWGTDSSPSESHGRAMGPYALLALCTLPLAMPLIDAAARMRHEQPVSAADWIAIALVLAAGVAASSGYSQWHEATTVARYRYPR
jgi:uncharacterized membrane protein